MDILPLLFYGLICGLLAYFSPVFGGRITRFGVGVLVGLVAAGILPLVRSFL